MGRLVGVAVGVVAFHPCGEGLGRCGVPPVYDVDTLGGSFLEHLAEHPAIARRGLSEILLILLLRHVLVLKHLAIYEEVFVGDVQADTLHCLLSGSHVPEIVFSHSRRRIHGVGMNADVLGCVVAESAYSKVEQVVDKLHIVFLEILVFRIHVGESSGAPEGTLIAVVVVLHRIQSLRMVKLIASSGCLHKVVAHRIHVKGRMVWEHVYYHAYIIFSGRIHHLLHFVAGAEDMVSHLPVGRLIVEIPLSLLFIIGEEHPFRSFRIPALLHRRGLHHGISCIGDLLHVVGDVLEVPAPCVEYGLGAGGMDVGIFCEALCRGSVRDDGHGGCRRNHQVSVDLHCQGYRLVIDFIYKDNTRK